MELIVDTRLYGDDGIPTFFGQILNRLQVQPENGLFFLIFLLAIIHSFFAPSIHAYARRKREFSTSGFKFYSFLSFIGEVEVVFGLWAIPLLTYLALNFGWSGMIEYVDRWDYQEPLYILVTMAIASTYPIFHAFEHGVFKLLRLCNGKGQGLWWMLLILGPLTGAVFKEGVAMTLSLLVLRKYLLHQLSPKLLYATVALLFLNVSLAGALTTFASSASLIIAHYWQWDSSFIFTQFGIKALFLILLLPTLGWLFFKKELGQLGEIKEEKESVHVPFWVTGVHLLFLFGVILFGHQPVLFLGLFVLFLGFTEATPRFQTSLPLRGAILIAFFLATVILHAGLQGFWVEALLHHLGHNALLPVSMLLTSLNHNAAVAYLATLTPNLSFDMKEAIFSGIVAGGGLTLIANGPNMIGYRFLTQALAPVEPSVFRLTLWAIPPTFIAYLVFALI